MNYLKPISLWRAGLRRTGCCKGCIVFLCPSWLAIRRDDGKYTNRGRGFKLAAGMQVRPGGSIARAPGKPSRRSPWRAWQPGTT